MPYCKKCGNELAMDSKFCPKCGTPVESVQAAPSGYATPSAPESGPRLAFWGERFVAWVIDIIIISVLMGALGLFTWFATGAFTWWSNWPSWVPFFNVGSVVYFLYWMLMDGAYGQSLGKMILRLKVTRLDGSRIDMGHAALESLGKAFLLPIDVLLGWILYPRRRQRLFNYVSETIVVQDRK
jgi:uncharacterized RDD family membrane protein YckC